MKKIQILIPLVALIGLAAVPAAAQPTAAKQWNVSNANQLSHGTEYELYNKSAHIGMNTQIGYENQTFGVDLGWVGHGGGYFEFLRQAPSGVRDHRSGPIAHNENVALYNTKTRRYLVYYSRFDADGVAELEWNNAPVYEWQIHGQFAFDGRIHFALFNKRVKKYLVHQFPKRGIDLGWLTETPRTP